jgi:hypothetical protein
MSFKKKRERTKAFLALEGTSTYILVLMLLAGSGFVLLSPTPMSIITTAFAQEEGTNNTTPAGAATTTTTTNDTATATTTTGTLSSGIKLSPQPIYQESVPPGSVTPINQTHIAATHTGNGTLTIPNSNQTINVISNGTAIFSLVTPSAIAKETIRAPNGETATITIYEIVQFSNPAEAPLGGGKGLKIIKFNTNSTGILAPLDGVIASGINDLQPNGESELTAWRWESGIPLSTGTTATATTTPTEDSPPMETPTATDATADDTTATTPPVEGGEEEQATTTIPAPTPLLE